MDHQEGPPEPGAADPQEGEGVGKTHLTRPRFRVLLSSSGMGRYTARATQLAKMVSKMIVSKGLWPGLRRTPECGVGLAS